MSHFDSFYCKNYQRMLGILYSSFLIFVKYSEEDVVYKEDIVIYRNVNKFLTNFERKTKKQSEIESHFIVRYCFQDSAEQ